MPPPPFWTFFTKKRRIDDVVAPTVLDSNSEVPAPLNTDEVPAPLNTDEVPAPLNTDDADEVPAPLNAGSQSVAAPANLVDPAGDDDDVDTALANDATSHPNAVPPLAPLVIRSVPMDVIFYCVCGIWSPTCSGQLVLPANEADTLQSLEQSLKAIVAGAAGTYGVHEKILAAGTVSTDLGTTNNTLSNRNRIGEFCSARPTCNCVAACVRGLVFQFWFTTTLQAGAERRLQSAVNKMVGEILGVTVCAHQAAKAANARKQRETATCVHLIIGLGRSQAYASFPIEQRNYKPNSRMVKLTCPGCGLGGPALIKAHTHLAYWSMRGQQARVYIPIGTCRFREATLVEKGVTIKPLALRKILREKAAGRQLSHTEHLQAEQQDAEDADAVADDAVAQAAAQPVAPPTAQPAAQPATAMAPPLPSMEEPSPLPSFDMQSAWECAICASKGSAGETPGSFYCGDFYCARCTI
jgi:hypothetical protein